MRRLTAKEKKLWTSVPWDGDQVAGDWPRRMRNALLALMDLDRRGWMLWCEREIDLRWPLCRQTRLVEARARALVLSRYRSSICSGREIGELVFCDAWIFNDRGNLMAG